MSGYAFHPDAFADLDEIWEYIAQDNVDAADRVLADIHSTLTLLAGSPQIGHRRRAGNRTYRQRVAAASRVTQSQGPA
jgi:antitoxin ParD1/3/4/toxin ParE1/3/4